MAHFVEGEDTNRAFHRQADDANPVVRGCIQILCNFNVVRSLREWLLNHEDAVDLLSINLLLNEKPSLAERVTYFRGP